MFSLDDLEKIKELLAQFSPGSHNNSGKEEKGSKKNNNDRNKDKKDSINLTPSQLLVIAGFVSGVLEVSSILVDKNQGVEILLTGTLKRKTQLDKIMEQIGHLPFEEVMKSIIDLSE